MEIAVKGFDLLEIPTFDKFEQIVESVVQVHLPSLF